MPIIPALLAELTQNQLNLEVGCAYHHLQPYILPIITGLFVSILSGLFGFWLGGKRERITRNRCAKDKFLEVVADQRAKFDTMRLREAEFFEQSVPAFTQAVQRIEYFLPPKQWACLKTILQEYQSHHKSEFEGGHARIVASIKADLGTGKTHSQTLREFLDRFAECIHKST